jgi:hypothetical protein
MSARAFVRFAHASRVLAMASTPTRTLLPGHIRSLSRPSQMERTPKVRRGGTPRPAHETRALPGNGPAAIL